MAAALDTAPRPGRARREGYEQACAAALSEDGSHAYGVVGALDSTVGPGEQAWAERCARGSRSRPDLVMAASDLLAFGVMRAALSAGLHIPRQLGVVGIDGTLLARAFSPPLTSVSLDARERGRIAARLLLDRLDAPTALPRTERVEPVLVVRESSAPASPSGRR